MPLSNDERVGKAGSATTRVVKAEPHHVDPVWNIIDRSRAALNAAGIAQWEDDYPNRAGVETDVQRDTLFVLESAEGCLACITLDENADHVYATAAWTTSEPALIVHRLCVDPAAQGRRYSHLLMDFAERYATDHGYASVRLDAFTRNPRSVGLYRKRGYREVGQVFFPRRVDPFYLFEKQVAADRGPGLR